MTKWLTFEKNQTSPKRSIEGKGVALNSSLKFSEIQTDGVKVLNVKRKRRKYVRTTSKLEGRQKVINFPVINFKRKLSQESAQTDIKSDTHFKNSLKKQKQN